MAPWLKANLSWKLNKSQPAKISWLTKMFLLVVGAALIEGFLVTLCGM